jgi:ABC-type arginine transport system permease subunit
MDVLYASAVGSLMSTQIRSYPNIVHVSGLFFGRSSVQI